MKQREPEFDRASCTFFRTEARMTASAEDVEPIDEATRADVGIIGVSNAIAATSCEARMAGLPKQDGAVSRIPHI